METPTDLAVLELALKELLSTIPNNDTELSWNRVADTARALANGLRIRDGPVDHHSILGGSLLPQSLSALLALSLHGSPTPKTTYANATHELLRAAANFCMDHDDNRANLLDAGFPQAVVSLLEGYSDPIPIPPSRSPLPLNISDLKIIRTSIGVLLNASLGFDPVQLRLISLELPFTILKLSSAIFPAGYCVNPVPAGGSETDEASWIIRRDISNWSWRIINELKDFKSETVRIFDAKVLPLLTPSLLQFCEPPSNKLDSLFEPGSSLFSTLLHADFEILEESCTLIEALALDMEDVRLSLARGLYNLVEHGGVPCLSTILDFIEFGAYPLLWEPAFGNLERKRKEKGFDMCKAALIKAVVEVAGDDRNQDVLLEDTDTQKPGGRFVYRMVKWITDYVNDVTSRNVERKDIIDRDDLIICATLSLGNLAKKEKICTTLLTPPYALAPSLLSAHFLSPMADINVKHGIIGLLKHLAQSSTLSSVIRTSLYEAQVIQRISESGIWDEKSDAMADIVQVNAINVVKHLCNANIDFTLVTMALSKGDETNCKSAMHQILALVSRSDNVTIKSEGTRVLVNVVKSLWSNGSSKVSSKDKIILTHSDTEKQLKKELAISQLFTPECAFALASLVGRSGKYPILVNEGIVAMSLLSTRKEAGYIVLESLTKLLLEPTLPINEPVSPAGKGPSRLQLPKPRHALDMIVFVLRNVDNPVNFPVEIRVNACMFFVSLTRNVPGEQLSPIKESIRPVLERILESQLSTDGKEDMLINSARKLLDMWS